MGNARQAAFQTMKMSHDALGQQSRDMHSQMQKMQPPAQAPTSLEDDINSLNSSLQRRQQILTRNQNK